MLMEKSTTRLKLPICLADARQWRQEQHSLMMVIVFESVSWSCLKSWDVADAIVQQWANGDSNAVLAILCSEVYLATHRSEFDGTSQSMLKMATSHASSGPA